MIDRDTDRERVQAALRRSPVVLLVGPRQAGKTTLAQAIASEEPSTFLDLEDPAHAARLTDPMLALRTLTGLVVLDEAQHSPRLFPTLRVLADRPDRPARFLVLGSASPDLLGMSSETLAGRVEIIELSGLRSGDVAIDDRDRLWLHGGLPASFTAELAGSIAWRRNFVATFLQRDLAQLGSRVPAAEMRRFWTMLAHYHAQTWNGSELARSLGVSHPTVRRYVDTLTDALVVRQLLPWYENVGKRVVRSPKVYVRDTGLLHTLLGIETMDALLDHPKVGASWEGFVVEQVAALLGDVPLYFWATQSGAELDLFVELDGARIGIEVKRTVAPRITPSVRNATRDLGLDRVYVVHAGDDRFQLDERVVALPVDALRDPMALTSRTG